MNRRLALGIGLTATLIAPLAVAQEVTIGYQGLPYKTGGGNDTGVQVADGILLHSGIGAEAGYDTNVFYQDTGVHSSGIYVVSPYAELTNATRTGTVPSQFSFDLRAGLQYRRYESSDPTITPYENAWMPTAGVLLSSGTGQLGFGFSDTFARIEDAPYSPGAQPILRYNNQASVEARWAPGGGRLSTMLRYTNMIDVLPDAYSYATSDTNLLTLDVSWRWLPKTAIFVDIRQGYVSYLNSGSVANGGKVSSFPLYATAGLRGLLTERTSAIVTVGYENGFYSASQNKTTGVPSTVTTGGALGSLYLMGELTFRPTTLSRIVLGYQHDFANTIIGSFAYQDTVYLSYIHQIAERLAVDLSARYLRNNYQGFEETIPGAMMNPSTTLFVPRVDDLYQVGATLDYFMRNWAYLGLGYSLLDNRSNYVAAIGGSASYVKQQFFGRIGITY